MFLLSVVESVVTHPIDSIVMFVAGSVCGGTVVAFVKNAIAKVEAAAAPAVAKAEAAVKTTATKAAEADVKAAVVEVAAEVKKA